MKYAPADPTISIKCVDIHNGEIIWGWGFSDIYTIDPPIYYDSAVYVQVVNIGGMLYSYNLLDGSRRWGLPFYSQFYKHLGPVIYNNDILFMSGSYGGLTKANAKTGEFIWWRRFGDYDFEAPAVYNSNFYIWEAGTIFEFTIDTQELLWRNTIIYPVPSDIGGGPCIDTTEKIIFLEHPSNVFAVDMNTHEVLWTKNHPYPSSLSAGFTISVQGLTPAICEDRLYYINQDSLYCCDKFTGKNIWKYGTDNKFWSPPVIANGLLFVATRDSTFAFDLNSQEKVWSFPVGGQIAVGNNHLVLGSIEGELYIFGRVATEIEDDIVINLPTKFELFQNYPNPFNPTTEIQFTIPYKSNVTINIINIAGQKVRILSNQEYSTGNHTVTWDGKDDNGNQLSSGIYLYRLVTDNITLRKKMVLLK